MADYHLHLHQHAVDAPVTPDYSLDHIGRYVAQAATAGVTEICLTEHLYRCEESIEVLGRFWEGDPSVEAAAFTEHFVTLDRNLSLDRYVAGVVAAKQAGLPVRLGMEVDYFPETIDAVGDLLAQHPFDYLLGSVHWIGGLSTDTAEMQGEIADRGLRYTWEQYTELMVDLATSGRVDALAHIDVLKKFGQRPDPEPVELYEEMVEAVVAGGVAVEVSSQGLRNPAAEVYPAPTLLAMLQRAGVPITLASDGHTPDQTAHGHRDVVAAARAAGYREYLRFEARRPIPTPLPEAVAAW